MTAPTLRVLILEDNASDYELMKRELCRGGLDATIDWAQDEASFRRALDGQAPDVFLLDHSLPGFDGIRALKLVRERLPDTPVIIVSGVIGEEVAIETLKAGATDYVLKQRLGRLVPVILRALHEAEVVRQRRRAEEALDASRRRFEALFSSIREGICVHEVILGDDGRAVDCRILDVNPAFERIAGISVAEAVGMHASELYHDDELAYLERYAEVARTGEPITFEAYFPSFRRHLLVSVFSPEPGQFATLFVDITDRKDLERKLKQRAEELVRFNEELQQFAYVASHDLQEPLRMVIGYLSLLERRYGDQLDEKARECLDHAVDGGFRASGLIQDLLEYSRAGSVCRDPKPVDAESLLNKVCDNLRLQMQEEGATVTHDPLPTVMADPSQLTVLLQNLISNAIKFHADKPPAVHVSCAEEPDRWVFCVRDNGIGIDPAHQDRIFQIFQRLHTREEYEGTGMGLAIAKKIVERRGGRIWVESEVGKGSSFYFALPKGGDP